MKPARVFRHPVDVKKCSPGTPSKSTCLKRPIGHGADVKWYRVATIAGIQVRIHLTFLLLLAFYAWIYYIDGGPQAAIDGVVFTLLIFLCVLLHEFGHALAARTSAYERQISRCCQSAESLAWRECQPILNRSS